MNKKDRVWIFLQKMNEQLQYAWNFQLSMLSLKNGFHSHLLPLVHPHQRFTPISKLATNTTKTTTTTTTTATKKKKNRRSEQACLIWKRKRTRECFWRIEDQPSMKSDGYTHLFFFFSSVSLSLSLGKFQPYYSVSY